LDSYGFDTFLAHEDLKPSEEWQKSIFTKLKACAVFLPLLTKAFTESDWTDQETGIAVALKKIIVPMKVSLNPYGFVNKYQAQSFPEPTSDGDMDGACWNIVNKLGSDRKIGSAVKDGVIKAFGRSRSFNEASTYAARLRSLEPYSSEQLDEIVKWGCKNNQIHYGFEARSYVNDLIQREKGRVDKNLARKFVELQA